MDENRWRRYNWSGKFINEPPLPNWWNNASEGKNISQNFPRMVWGPAFVGKWILATRRSKERHLFYQVTQLWKRFPMEEGDAIKANGCLCLLARTRWKLQKKKQFFSREVVPDFHWMRIVYIYTWRNVYAKIWKLWIGKAKGAIFIGPRSDHSLPMSLTDWLTDDLDEDLMNWPLLLESNI